LEEVEPEAAVGESIKQPLPTVTAP